MIDPGLTPPNAGSAGETISAELRIAATFAGLSGQLAEKRSPNPAESLPAYFNEPILCL